MVAGVFRQHVEADPGEAITGAGLPDSQDRTLASSSHGGVPSEIGEKLIVLERENRGLREVDEILRKA